MTKSAHNAVRVAGSLALIVLLVAAFGASSASAIGITNWEAGTCAAPGCTYNGSPSEFFAQAAALPGAPSYDKRFSAYELSYCEGREREAYQRLRQLYETGENERLPTLIARLTFLENKLNIAQDQRTRETEPLNR